jgi:hypothetical protein
MAWKLGQVLPYAVEDITMHIDILHTSGVKAKNYEKYGSGGDQDRGID